MATRVPVNARWYERALWRWSQRTMRRWCNSALLPTLVPPRDGTLQAPDVNNAGTGARPASGHDLWVVNKPNKDRWGFYGFGSMTRASSDTHATLTLAAHHQTERRMFVRNDNAVGRADIETDEWFERAGASGRIAGPAHDGRGDELVGTAALPLDGDLALPPRRRRRQAGRRAPQAARREQLPLVRATGSRRGRSRGLGMVSLATGVVVLIVAAIVKPVTPAPEPTADVEPMTAPLATIGQAADHWREQIDRADRRAAHRRAIARRRTAARRRAVRAAQARQAARVPPAPTRVVPRAREFTPPPAPAPAPPPRRATREFDF
jgi:hypothetical protein